MKNLAKTMRKPSWSFALNAAMALCMSAVIGIGFLIKYTLISGLERKSIYGKNVDLYLFNMDRHQWGTIHFILGLVFFALLAIHVFLHAKVISTMYNKLVKTPLTKKLLAFIFILLCALFLLVPFFITPKIKPLDKGKGQQVTLVTDLTSNLQYLCTVNY